MPSPITYKFFEKMKFDARASLCNDVVPKIVNIITGFYEFYKYMYNTDGTPSKEFIQDLCNLNCQFSEVINQDGTTTTLPPGIQPPSITYYYDDDGNLVTVVTPPTIPNNPATSVYTQPPNSGVAPIATVPSGESVEITTPQGEDPPDGFYYTPQAPGVPPFYYPNPTPPAAPSGDGDTPQAESCLYPELQTTARFNTNKECQLTIKYKLNQQDTGLWSYQIRCYASSGSGYSLIKNLDNLDYTEGTLERDKTYLTLYPRYPFNPKKLFYIKVTIQKSGCSPKSFNTNVFGAIGGNQQYSDAFLKLDENINCGIYDVKNYSGTEARAPIRVYYESNSVTFGNYLKSYTYEMDDGNNYIATKLLCYVDYVVSYGGEDYFVQSYYYEPINVNTNDLSYFQSFQFGDLILEKNSEYPNDFIKTAIIHVVPILTNSSGDTIQGTEMIRCIHTYNF